VFVNRGYRFRSVLSANAGLALHLRGREVPVVGGGTEKALQTCIGSLTAARGLLAAAVGALPASAEAEVW
jgi:hypothetical protein